MVFIKQQTYGNDWGSPSCRMREIPPWETGHSTRPTGDDPTGRQIFFRWFRDSVGEFSWKWYEMMALLEDSPKNHMVLHHFPMKTTMKGGWNHHFGWSNSHLLLFFGTILAYFGRWNPHVLLVKWCFPWHFWSIFTGEIPMFHPWTHPVGWFSTQAIAVKPDTRTTAKCACSVRGCRAGESDQKC